MATALIVTFISLRKPEEVFGGPIITGITSQTINFVDVPQAEKAFERIRNAYELQSDIAVDGVILKDVII